MAFYRTREGALTAADSFTALGSLYGQSTTSSIQIPKQASQIVGIVGTVSQDGATAGTSTFAMQLSGDGLSQGQETIVVGSSTNVGTETSDGRSNLPFALDVAIPVVGSNQVSVAMAMDTDLGTCACAVTLVFA
jgi:hypothetical protein